MCATCGARLRAGDRFCDRCGSLTGAEGAPGTTSASPRSYLPHHLAERIAADRNALEGERKQVTVLLADIKSSLELLAGRDPEDARRILDPVLTLMMDCVHHYEGTVNQVMGDGIMALFGAPIAHEDHPLRACYAALRIQEHLAVHSAQLLQSTGLQVQVRIGINSGEVIVRAIGSDLAMDYTAVGSTVHLAGRLEQMAAPSTILCTTSTLSLVEGFVRVRRLGSVPVRGLEAPVDIAEIIGAGPARRRFETAISRGLATFVGRQTELETVQRALALAEGGQGQIVTLVGGPGVGKSRFCWEVSRVARERGGILLEAGGLSYARGFAYGVIAGLLRSYFQIEDRDDARRVREKVTSRLLGLDEALGGNRIALLSLLGVPLEDPEWLALDSLGRRQRTNEAVVALLLREALEQPTVLVLEDLHWVDHETEALLDELGERIASARMLILATHRPEHRHAWRRGVRCAEIHLGPLPSSAAEAVVRERLGDDPSLASLRAALVHRTGGNPLFIEETIRTLGETGVLVGSPGSYRLGDTRDRIDVPASVQSILAARVDRLPRQDKAILQVVAAVGGDAPLPLLRGVAQIPAPMLRAGLNRLRDAGFLHEVRLYPELTYACSHEIMREVAYGSLVQERRKALHAEILGAAEEFYGLRRFEHVEYLAHHAFLGEVWEKAVAYAHEAGLRAASRSAYREAVGFYERALSIVPRLPNTLEHRQREIDVRFGLRNALFPLGEIPRDLDSLRSVMAAAESLPDRRRLGWLLAYVARDHSLLGAPAMAIELGTRARGVADALGDRDLQLLTDAYLGAASYALGHYDRAASLLRPCVAALSDDRLAQRLGMPGPAFVFVTCWLVWALAQSGAFAEAVQRAQEAIEVAASSEQPLSLAVASYSAGFLAVHKGDLSGAIPLLERALELSERWNLTAWLPNFTSGLGYAYALSGRVAEGRRLLERSIEENERLGTMTAHAWQMTLLAECRLLQGDRTEALALARSAIELARTYQERGNEARAHAVMAEARACVEGEEPEALDAYRVAMRIAGELGMQPLLHRCHVGLAALHRRAGDDASAVSETEAAKALLHGLGLRAI
jgi:class 3 adenylate cyclase/tetratricopeptide (TPR) repeat protein